MLILAVKLECWSCNIQNVDSLFSHHIESINDSINKYTINDTIKCSFGKDDSFFLYMLMFISNFNFDLQGYTHQPMINRRDLNEIEIWYQENRKRLNWKKIETYIYLYDKIVCYPHASLESFNFDLYEKYYDDIFIEMDNLSHVNTFIDEPNQ
jgi:hypothetical protein